MIALKVGGKIINFLLDMGAQRSVVTEPIAPLTKETVKIIGATEKLRKDHCSKTGSVT